jgi:hypothetical protein
MAEKYTERIMVPVTPEMKEAVKKIGEDEDRNMSQMARLLFAEGLARREQAE